MGQHVKWWKQRRVGMGSACEIVAVEERGCTRWVCNVMAVDGRRCVKW